MPVRLDRRELFRYLLTVGAVLALAAGLLVATGFSVPNAAAALWRGSLGSPDAALSSTAVRAVHYIILGSAMALAFRVGVFNIGGDGQFLIGASCATWLALLPLPIPALGQVFLTLFAGAAGGVLWAWGPALLKRRLGVFEVLSTLMMNFIALHTVSYLVRGPMQEATGIYPQSGSIPEALRLPIIVPGSRLHAGVLLSFLCVATIWIWMTRRESGLRARLTGANATAAASAGRIDTKVIAWRTFLASAALCGLAGAVEVLGVTYALYENLSPAYGFTAIVVALLAALHPIGVIGSALVIAAFDAGASAMQRDAGVPSVTAWIIQALLVLGVLVVRITAQRERSRAAA
jgi:general nucleoside transport system permease protein